MAEEIRVHVVDRGRKFLSMRFVDPLTGKKVERSTGVKAGSNAQRRKADKVAAVWESELRDGRYQQPSKVMWTAFRDRYETEKLAAMSDDYACVMAATFNHFEALGVARLADVQKSVSRFESSLRSKKVKESTIRCYLKHLRAALGWAHEMGLLTEVPKVKLPKRARTTSKMKGRPITLEEHERMLAAAATVRPDEAQSWQDYLTGLWLSGLRLGESVALSWDDDADFSIDLLGKRPQFRIWGEGQKSGKDQYLPMTPDFAEWLLSRTPESDRVGLVFSPRGQQGRLLKADAIGRTVSRIGEKANVVVNKAEGKFATAQDLRRSFATRWAKRVKPATLQLLMRHEDIATTMAFYVALDADEVAEELWQQHGAEAANRQESGGLGDTLGDTSRKPGKQQSPQDVVTSHGQMSYKVGTTGFEPATS
jgi:integrase